MHGRDSHVKHGDINRNEFSEVRSCLVPPDPCASLRWYHHKFLRQADSTVASVSVMPFSRPLQLILSVYAPRLSRLRSHGRTLLCQKQPISLLQGDPVP